MKKVSKTLLLVALFMGMAIPSWGQASTEGTDFWVALTLSANPGGGGFTPFIAISTQDYKDCKVTITSPSNPSWAGYTKTLTQAWETISSTDLAASGWFNDDFKAQAGTIQSQGLYVHADKNVSVFCAWQGTESFDASNILPVTVLQDEYIVQDYPPYDNDGKTGYSTFAVVATEDGTIIDITPKEKTYDNHGAGTTYQPARALKKGEVYHVLSSEEKTLSGTRIKARGGKKIAVFNGDVMTRVPDKKMGNRDLLYEQAMPIIYWGREFAVTRSLRKDANRVRITATEDGTEVYVAGSLVATLGSGDTYEFELAKTGFVPKSNRESGIPDIVYEDAVSVSTSCPCAVYLYDVGKSYRAKDGETETSNDYGDPSMVWISPLEQSIKHITFGVCGTNYTKDHCVNIIKRTKDQTVSLKNSNNAELLGSADVFTPVPGNEEFSYLRKLLVNNQKNVTESFTLSSDSGVIAHVYGSGENESYAYSVGSAAVSLGTINVGGNSGTQQFQDGTVAVTPFCIDDILTFDASAGSSTIDKIVWDFGDGTTVTTYEVPTATHQYTTPGWYDVTATLSAHKDCPDVYYPGIDIQFSFLVKRADTIAVAPTHVCLSLEDQADTIRLKGQAYLDDLVANGKARIVNPDAPCYEDKQLSFTKYDLATEYEDPNVRNVRDSVKIGDTWYYAQPGVQDIYDTIPNKHNCDSIILYHMRITTSLVFELTTLNGQACGGTALSMPYNYTKGEIGKAWLVNMAEPDRKIALSSDVLPTTLGTGTLDLPTENLKPGNYNMTLYLVDAVFTTDTTKIPFRVQVLYPASIFKIKFGNVLAVYNSKNNGGYQFTSFQWYKNGEPIPGAKNESVYHSDVPFVAGDEFYVILTDANGMSLQSCPQKYTPANEAPQNEQTSAQKILRDRHLYIQKDDMLYDIYGQRVK